MPLKKKTNVKKLTAAIQEAFEQSIQESVAQLDADLKNGSPVDSGRFRASWFHLQGTTTPGSAVVPEPEGDAKVPAPDILKPGEINPKLDQVSYNALPYASRLCESGWSKQVDPDWFTFIANQWEAGKYLDEALKDNGIK